MTNNCVLRRVRLLLVCLGLTITLASCGSSASANGEKACVLVNRSLAILAQSHTPSATDAPVQQRALGLLRQALPYAAIAAGSNGNFQPLEATLSESNRVDIQDLKTALTAECASANVGNANAPGVFEQASIPPSTTTPR